jgi:uncharacterized phiE125 gp8 family phage protein
MILTTLAEPAAEPVGLAEAKAFLRITGAGEDGLVTELVAAARTAIEDAVGLALISRTLRVTLDGWPMVLHARRRMTLPVRPAVSLEGVRIVRDGVPEDLTAQFSLTPGRSARLSWVSGVLPRTGPGRVIEIDYVAGFGAEAGDVADSLRLAVKRMTAHIYETRQSEGRSTRLPDDVTALVAPWRRVRL